jgi:hypothetical protein
MNISLGTWNLRTVSKVDGGQAHRQEGDVINLIYSFMKERRLKRDHEEMESS